MFKTVLFVSVALNIIMLLIYFYKLSPETKALRNEFENQKMSENTTLIEEDCPQKVYDKSLGQVVCMRKERSRSEALSECSSKVLETMKASVGTNIDVNDFEKARNSFMTICMNGYGMEY